MSAPKWLPKDLQYSYHLFGELEQMVTTLRCLGKRFIVEINLNEPEIGATRALVKQARLAFHVCDELQAKMCKTLLQSTDKRADRNPYKQLLTHKLSTVVQNLTQIQFQLLFIINRRINMCLSAALMSERFVDDALTLTNLYNHCVGSCKLENRFGRSERVGAGDAQVCSNSFTTILLPQARIDIKYILQTISKYRSEHCCMALISCLLATCKIDASSTANSESDTSSIEILKTLTSHMSAAAGSGAIDKSLINDPAMSFFDRMASVRSSSPPLSSLATTIADEKVPSKQDPSNADYLERLVSSEENYYAFILLKCLKICQSVFDKSPTKADVMKWMHKGTRGLWTQTGGTLEHVVLWWCSTPLACQPVAAARHLRDWLISFQFDDAPETVLSILHCLGETMTVHVACTTWDKQFRLTLVSSSLPIDYKFERTEFYTSKSELHGTTTTGRLWSELLHTLTTFSNNCDQCSTIPNELPIVEQISILHRLDHSIHTMRLWAAAKAKALCTDWSMSMFFQVVENDVNQCLEQIKRLRVPDLVPTDAIEVEVKVNVALRAKLVSEVKVNICKLKLTYSECIEVMASICKMLSLATLRLCFPKSREWQCDHLQDKANDYVADFLNQIYLPVLHATQVIDILNLVLRIMCESWLDHIYMRKIKFSRPGALNLLRDFEGVAEWIIACNYVRPEHVPILSKHEVLRTCEGVGKILLRKPFEIISMTAKTMQYTPNSIDANGKATDHNTNDQSAQLPPEMFVPNQQRWLELRARNRKRFGPNCLCMDQTCVSVRHEPS